ncbi:MAG: stage V sporulation protein AC [Clostridiales bacterium]|nr:stage V sporulation protein AC [Clostridiales bacterium]
MSITNQQYDQMVKDSSPPSKSIKNIPVAFLVGGMICTIGQVILKVFENYNFDRISASTWLSIILILTSAVLTGFGLYEKIAKHAGAGTLVPITGFANSVVSPALECKTEGFVLGVGAKIFTIAGPVILYGTAASIIYGLVYYLFL